MAFPFPSMIGFTQGVGVSIFLRDALLCAPAQERGTHPVAQLLWRLGWRGEGRGPLWMTTPPEEARQAISSGFVAK
jgi:hypothetical protein